MSWPVAPTHHQPLIDRVEVLSVYSRSAPSSAQWARSGSARSMARPGVPTRSIIAGRNASACVPLPANCDGDDGP